ncbi:DUF4861 family protein [Paraflavisolibacter sp. H34]|uniref:DUF4861 family protein n=1 Tax=Huijunlia imazamoxiresistens TaxID=3127457 RepID=UPI003017356C
MKKVSLGFFLSALFFAAAAQPRTLLVSNPSPMEKKEEVIDIDWQLVTTACPTLDTGNFKVVNARSGKEYPYQLEYKGTSRVHNLLVQLTLPANATVPLQLATGKPRPVAAKTYCRYVPERKDDFAWENDRIAHRAYGKALENTPAEMAYGVDVWVKRTHRLILNERYQRKGNYHEDNGDGLDYYHVGLSLGAGAIAPYIHDTLWYPKNYRGWKVLDNGPLRSTFQLFYEEWTAAGIPLRMTKTISISAGSQLSRNEVSWETGRTDSLPVAAGIIKRKEQGELLLNEQEGILAYWEPRHGADGTTGVACVLTTPVTAMLVNKEHALAQTFTRNQQNLVYYQGAAWDKAGQIASAPQWFHYLANFKNNLNHPVIISLKTGERNPATR